MKQCPKCNNTCEDNAIICQNCGYLFDAFVNEDQSDGYQNAVPPQMPEQPTQPQNTQQGVPPLYGNDMQAPQNPVQNQPPIGMPPVPPQGMPPQGIHGYSPYNPQNNVPVNPYQNQYDPYNQQIPKTNGLATASMVLGIIGLVSSCCYGFGGVIGIVGLILGIISKGKIQKSNGTEKGDGQALAGIILSAISILILICVVVFIATNYDQFISLLHKSLNESREYYNQ